MSKKFNYESFTSAIVRHILDTHSPDDMLAWQLEMDNDPSDQFFSELTRQLKERHPEHWEDTLIDEEEYNGT